MRVKRRVLQFRASLQIVFQVVSLFHMTKVFLPVTLQTDGAWVQTATPSASGDTQLQGHCCYA